MNGRTGKWSVAEGQHHKGTVLVVDDEPESLELMRVLLASQGYSVATAPGSEPAVHLVERGDIDLVICDLMMSKMDGVELCAYIRRRLGLEHLPIVFVTSLHDRASRIRAKEAGADDFLVKPVDGLELLVRVESLLRTRASIERAQRERNQLLVELSKLRELLLGERARAEGVASPHALLELVRLHREQLEKFARGELSSAPNASADVLVQSARELEAFTKHVADESAALGHGAALLRSGT